MRMKKLLVAVLLALAVALQISAPAYAERPAFAGGGGVSTLGVDW